MNTTTNTEIKIVNDINAELQAGMFVTCRLGNPGDIDWSPMATVLLLHTNVVCSGPTQFTGLYKNADGSFWVARFLTKSYLRRNAEERKDGENLDQGIMYCTSSLPVDMETKSSEYFTDGENKSLAWALQHHRAKIEQLPVALRYKNGVCVDQPALVGNISADGNDFLQAEKLWNFLKNNHRVVSNPGRYGTAQAGFDTRNVEKLKQLKNEVLAEELFDLQAPHNSGRGITCVRGIVNDIKRGDLPGAFRAASTDWDKISGYRNVAEWLKHNEIVPNTDNFYISSIAQ